MKYQTLVIISLICTLNPAMAEHAEGPAAAAALAEAPAPREIPRERIHGSIRHWIQLGESRRNWDYLRGIIQQSSQEVSRHLPQGYRDELTVLGCQHARKRIDERNEFPDHAPASVMDRAMVSSHAMSESIFGFQHAQALHEAMVNRLDKAPYQQKITQAQQALNAITGGYGPLVIETWAGMIHAQITPLLTQVRALAAERALLGKEDPRYAAVNVAFKEKSEQMTEAVGRVLPAIRADLPGDRIQIGIDDQLEPFIVWTHQNNTYRLRLNPAQRNEQGVVNQPANLEIIAADFLNLAQVSLDAAQVVPRHVLACTYGSDYPGEDISRGLPEGWTQLTGPAAVFWTKQHGFSMQLRQAKNEEFSLVKDIALRDRVLPGDAWPYRNPIPPALPMPIGTPGMEQLKALPPQAG